MNRSRHLKISALGAAAAFAYIGCVEQPDPIDTHIKESIIKMADVIQANSIATCNPLFDGDKGKAETTNDNIGALLKASVEIKDMPLKLVYDVIANAAQGKQNLCADNRVNQIRQDDLPPQIASQLTGYKIQAALFPFAETVGLSTVKLTDSNVANAKALILSLLTMDIINERVRAGQEDKTGLYMPRIVLQPTAPQSKGIVIIDMPDTLGTIFSSTPLKDSGVAQPPSPALHLPNRPGLLQKSYPM